MKKSSFLKPIALLISLLFWGPLAPHFAYGNTQAYQPFCSRVLSDFFDRLATGDKIPRYIENVDPLSQDWIRRSVRSPVDDTHINKELKNLLLNSYRAIRDILDPVFRSGTLSGQWEWTLRRLHKVFSFGDESIVYYPGVSSEKFYLGITTKQMGLSINPAYIAAKVGTFMFENHKSWNRNRIEAEPIGFSPHATIFIEGLKEHAIKNGVSESEMDGLYPVNQLVHDRQGRLHKIQHAYPVFKFQRFYIYRMGEILFHIENSLLRPNPSTPVLNILHLIADFYHVGINAHLFESVNNSMLMAGTNYFLQFMGLEPIYHGKLDYAAIQYGTYDFRNFFVQAVKDQNPHLIF